MSRSVLRDECVVSQDVLPRTLMHIVAGYATYTRKEGLFDMMDKNGGHVDFMVMSIEPESLVIRLVRALDNELKIMALVDTSCVASAMCNVDVFLNTELIFGDDCVVHHLTYGRRKGSAFRPKFAANSGLSSQLYALITCQCTSNWKH